MKFFKGDFSDHNAALTVGYTQGHLFHIISDVIESSETLKSQNKGALTNFIVKSSCRKFLDFYSCGLASKISLEQF